MRRTKNLTLVVSPCLLGMVLICSKAAGSGIILYELGTPDVGLASAGYAARAQDASILFRNPAGMSLLEDSEVQPGGQFLYGDFAFRANRNTDLSGSGGGEFFGPLPGGSIFYVQRLTDDLKIGFGAFSYFGLTMDYEDDWVGRYYVREATLAGITLMPSASYRVTEWLSVGAGLNAMMGFFDHKEAVNDPTDHDGRLELNDEEWGFGADVGILIEPIKGTRVGVTYLSPVDLDFEDKPSFKGLGATIGAGLGAAGLLTRPVDLEVTVPQSFMLSAYQEVTEEWAIMGNAGWQDWSEFGKVEIAVSSETPRRLTFDRKYDDTWHAAFGTQFRLNDLFLEEDAFLISAGFAYDSSPIKDSERTVDFPIGEMYRIGAGIRWELNPAIAFGGGYELIWLGDLHVDQERGLLSHRVAGKYPNSAIHVGAINVSVRF